MAHSISGNAGSPNVNVYWYSTSTFQGTFVVADGAGHYNTGEVLDDDTYNVIPVKLGGYVYNPISASVIVSGADVTGVDFAAPTHLTDTFTFTQLYEDTFHRPNESPLNPAEWTNAFAPDVTQIVNNECVINLAPTNVGQDSDCKNIARNWLPTTDQWLEVTLQDISIGICDVYLRSGAGKGTGETLPTYRLDMNLGTDISTLNFTSISLTFTLDQIDITGAVIVHSWVEIQPYPFQVGDKVRFGIIGDATTGHLYVFVNGVLIYKAALADSPAFIPTGNPGFQLASAAGSGFRTPDPPQATNDIGISNFKAGSFVLNPPAPSVPYSVPDCRVPPAGPNASRTVQGTKIHDAQTSSNSAIPPVDSRAAGAPVDCRVVSIIPQNSRTPGTFGPGE